MSERFRRGRSASLDEAAMTKVIALAATTRGLTSPDPMVACLIVKKNKIVTRGYHGEVGTPHAEAFALHKAGPAARGAALYVNLEPCCHFGNNPPCTSAIIQSGIKRVVAAIQDPNPLVAGKGFRELRSAGIEVVSGVLEKEARQLNEAFIKYITTGKPFIMIKTAMTLDGKIATASGESKYISSPESRALSHEFRNGADGILVGIETVLRDDPRLNVRGGALYKRRVPPYKIVLDSQGRTPPTASLFHEFPDRTLIVTTRQASRKRLQALRQRGAQIVTVKSSGGRVDIRCAIAELGARGISSLLVEGGGKTNASLIEAGLVDKIALFIAPKILGGAVAPTPFEGKGVRHLHEALTLKDVREKRVGSDLLIEGYV